MAQDCSFDWDTPVTVADDGSFPGPVVRDGVINSFRQRLVGAVDMVNAQLNRTSTFSYYLEYVTGPSQIQLRSEDIDGLGSTVRTHRTGQCTLQGSTPAQISTAIIRVDKRPDWHTQARRETWENCPNLTLTEQRRLGIEYTCSKEHDVESLMAHEIIHALGGEHPSAIVGGYDLARCGVNGEATICNALRDYRAGQQTLEDYDYQVLLRGSQNS